MKLFILLVFICHIFGQNSDILELVLNETETELPAEPVTATLPDLTTVHTKHDFTPK